MAYPTAVNDQITDAVTKSNVQVIAEAPAMAIGTLYQSLAHSTGILFENATSRQNNMQILSQAVITSAVKKLTHTS